MTLETARKALDLLEPPGPWRVGFFGGEPLLAWDLVREVTELARARADRLGTRVRFSVTTNGTLLDEERARFLAGHGFSLIVSLDGPKELHDRERLTAVPQRSQRTQSLKGADEVPSSVNSVPSVASRCGNGSFEQVRRGLDAAAAAGLGARTTLRATFPLTRPALAERLEFLNGLADSGLARAVSVEPAWPAPSETGEGVQLGALPSEYLSAARWAVARLRAGRRVRYHHLQKALERVLLRRPAGTECGAGFGYLEVAPSGDIHACHKETGGAIGHVDSGVSERLRAPWRENRRYARRGCESCWARNVCGGGCRAESIEHTCDIARPWPVGCAAKRLQARAAPYVAATAPRGSLEKMFERQLRRPSTSSGRRPEFIEGRRAREAGRAVCPAT